MHLCSKDVESEKLMLVVEGARGALEVEETGEDKGLLMALVRGNE